jgi:tRNA_anti-like
MMRLCAHFLLSYLKHVLRDCRTAEELATDYDANEVAADLKYKNNGLLVLGTVEGIFKDYLGAPYVLLGRHKTFYGVQAKFSEKNSNSLAILSKGRKRLAMAP